ncbi:MAG: hypothetical protein AAGF73_17990 [Actinomycetota bacterium]
MTQQITGGVGDCVGALAIPADAVGVAMNVTAVNPTAQTNLRLFPADSAKVPTLSNLNVSAGQAPFPNKVDVALSPGGAIKLFNQNGQVSVLADVVGFYTKSSLSELDARLTAVEVDIAAKADTTTVYTQAEVDDLLEGKLDNTNVMWAVVQGTGGLGINQGAVSSRRTSPFGQFEVVFERDISRRCATIAAPADNTSFGIPLGREVTAQLRLDSNTGSDKTDSVLVQVFTSNGVLVNNSFTIVVICPS